MQDLFRNFVDYIFNNTRNKKIENLNNYQALKNLGACFISKGLRPVILKGLSYAILYPNMYHRKCSDLDVFVFDRRKRVMP